MVSKKGHNSYLPVLLFLFAALVWRTPYYVLSLYVAIPLLIVYCFYNYKRVIFSSKYFTPYLFVVVWMFLSSVANPNMALSLRMMIPIVASFLLSMSTYAIARSNENARMLFLTYVALFFFLMAMNMMSGGFVADFDYANELERRSNTILNANEYAYYSLFAIIGWRLYVLLRKKDIKPLLLACLYLLSAAISLYVALMIASRQVLLLQIPLLIYLFYIDFISGGKNKFVAVILVLAVIIALPIAVDLYNNSYLAVRSQVGFQEDARGVLMYRAIEEGSDNPIFGLGLGADTTFSHCTYTHLFSRSGFPALIGFILIMFRSLYEQWRRFLRTRRKSFLFYLGCLGIIAIGHFTYSYFNEPFMMSIMFAIIGSSDGEYKRIKTL